MNTELRPVRFITNGNKFSIEILEKETKENKTGFWNIKTTTTEIDHWIPIWRYSGDSLNGFSRHRIAFDSLIDAQQWVNNQNQKYENTIKQESWKVIEEVK